MRAHRAVCEFGLQVRPEQSREKALGQGYLVTLQVGDKKATQKHGAAVEQWSVASDRWQGRHRGAAERGVSRACIERGGTVVSVACTSHTGLKPRARFGFGALREESAGLGRGVARVQSWSRASALLAVQWAGVSPAVLSCD